MATDVCVCVCVCVWEKHSNHALTTVFCCPSSPFDPERKQWKRDPETSGRETIRLLPVSASPEGCAFGDDDLPGHRLTSGARILVTLPKSQKSKNKPGVMVPKSPSIIPRSNLLPGLWPPPLYQYARYWSVTFTILTYKICSLLERNLYKKCLQKAARFKLQQSKTAAVALKTFKLPANMLTTRSVT